MTNLINVELETLKAEDLRTIAKEYQMTGSWKAKKQEMIDFLEVKKSEQIKEIVEKESEAVEEDIQLVEISLPKKAQDPVKRTTKTREVILFDADDNFIREFKNQSEAIAFCMKEKLCNSGWLINSLKNNGRRFYTAENGKITKSKKYSGIGYYAMLKVTPLEKTINK